jgi:hypothetical protein
VVDLLIELALIGISWRFWLALAGSVAAAYVLFGSFQGWPPAMLMVCGAIAGIVWSSAHRV